MVVRLLILVGSLLRDVRVTLTLFVSSMAVMSPVALSLRCVFFFQAEDGIRDVAVTGVQTCALPILSRTVLPVMKPFAALVVGVCAFPVCLWWYALSSSTGASDGRELLTSVSGLGSEEIGRASCRERV